jgi:beta-lactamase regulating signal transducer with metallopeptidase domain
MWGALDRFGQVLVDATLATTVFMSLVVLLMLSCRQPARRLAIARAASVLSMLMIPLAAASPLPRINPFFWLYSDPDRPVSARTEAAPGATATGDPPLSEPVHGPGRWFVPLVGGGRIAAWIVRILAICYLAGVTAGVTWLLVGIWGMRRLIRRSIEPGRPLGTLYDELILEAAGRRVPPGLRVSPHIQRPILAGLFRPTILIPAGLEEPSLDRDSLRLVLVHELAHADQRDTVSGAAAGLAQCVWFFLPFLWWLRTQLRIDQEFMADQKTALLVGSSGAYATRLVALSAPREGTPGSRPIVGSVPMLRGWWWDGGFKSPLLQRVVMLLHSPYPIEPEAPRGWSAVATAAVLGLGILCSSLSLSVPSWQLAGRNDGRGTSFSEQPHSLHIPHFVASPRGASSSGRTVPYVLLLVLPPRFELTLEIQVSAQGLPRTRVAGLLLGPTVQTAAAAHPSTDQDPPASWHSVRLARHGTKLELEVDGVPVSLAPAGEGPSEWLTVEPPTDETVVLRDLRIIW